MAGIRRAVVLGGKTGLLGQALREQLVFQGCEVFAPVRQELDVFSEYDLAKYIDHCQPEIVFNTIAYTQVDKAEEEPEEATRVNEELCKVIASVVKTRPCRCFLISTDFVFDGKKGSPYVEDDHAVPASVYGRTKLAGEHRLLEVIPEKTLIGRTAWLFGPHKINFVQKVLNIARETGVLDVVANQIGSPTFTIDLAAMCLNLVNASGSGIYHLVNSGKASWYELAKASITGAGYNCAVAPISSQKFVQKASRPEYSVLSNRKYMKAVGETPRDWTDGLTRYLSLLGETVS